MFKILLILFFIIAGTIPASFAQTDGFIEITEKVVYSDDCITIVGKVQNVLPDVPVIIQVISPNDNLVDVRQLSVNDDLLFDANFSPSWKLNGEYTMKITYGGYSLEDVLHVVSNSSVPSTDIERIQEFTFEGKEYYFEGDNDMKNISVNDETNSIHYELKYPSHPCATFDYKLTSVNFYNPIVLDTQDDNQNEFLILVNDKPTDYKIDTITFAEGHSNIITFAVPYGTSSVDITVTKIVPEFGTIVMMVMIIAIIGIIAITKNSRILQPKF